MSEQSREIWDQDRSITYRNLFGQYADAESPDCQSSQFLPISSNFYTDQKVFSILVEYVTRNSWAEAFEAVIPQRKYHDGKRKRRKAPNGESASPGLSIQDEDEYDSGEDEEDEEMAENTDEVELKDVDVDEGGHEAVVSEVSRLDAGTEDQAEKPQVDT